MLGSNMTDELPEEDLAELIVENRVSKSVDVSEYYNVLVTRINKFYQSLDEQHEVGVRLVSFGETFVFHLDDIDYVDPMLLCFTGVTDGGQPVELIQHASQISILLMKVSKRPGKRIGFLGRKVDAK